MQIPLIQDPWLSGILEKETWRVELAEAFVRELTDNHAFRDTFVKRQQGRVFMYSKAPTMQLSWVHLLEDLDFHLIDTNVTFERPIRTRETQKNKIKQGNDKGGWEIRFAKQRDEEETMALAGSCFCYSRFHLDPAIPRKMADTVKAQWAGNYFRGKRGDSMVLALKDGFIAGFLQLLRQERTLIIDLIGVRENYRRAGIGGMLIDYAETQCGDFETIRVGTQIANAPSLRFYEKHGFRVAGSNYVFHFHGKD